MLLLGRDAREKCEAVLGEAATEGASEEARDREPNGVGDEVAGKAWVPKREAAILFVLVVCGLAAFLLLRNGSLVPTGLMRK